MRTIRVECIDTVERLGLSEANPMSFVFQNIDPPPPSPPRECAFVAGGGHTRRVERGVGGSIFWKTQDTALYSTYIESSLIDTISGRSSPVPTNNHPYITGLSDQVTEHGIWKFGAAA
jgi:hypothetical protein